MDIVTRLKMFLEQGGISNSQFADTCDIPRPTLSQLLNGRNKKVSDEVIGKIHRAYPSLNIMWLMFGDGEMFTSSAGDQMAADNLADSQQAASTRNDEPVQRAISFDDDDSGSGYRRQGRYDQPMPPSMNETIQSIVRSSAAGRTTPRGAASPNARSVVNIVVFYSDGRFEQFGPMRTK